MIAKENVAAAMASPHVSGVPGGRRRAQNSTAAVPASVMTIDTNSATTHHLLVNLLTMVLDWASAPSIGTPTRCVLARSLTRQHIGPKAPGSGAEVHSVSETPRHRWLER